jgi:NTP pyrophosphatase (non-canonical NTP hydrolase)
MNETILRAALASYGCDRQILKMAEECAELTVALHHFQDGKVPAAKVIEELADVLIMANQMRLLFGPSHVDLAVDYKLDRLGKRVAHEG